MSEERPPEPRREDEPVPGPEPAATEPSPEDFAVWDPDFVPPDPNEPPPVELWRAVGDVTPWGTLFVLLPCTLLFLVLAVRAHYGWQADLYVWGGNATHLPLADSWWRVLAAMFLHSGAPHLFFNATTLLLFGPAVERLFTRHAFWVVYALGGAGASLASLAWRDVHGGGYSVGASGAIFALAGALLVGAYRLRQRLAVGRARSLGAAILYLAGTGFAAGFTQHGTDNVAHAGGLVCGALLASVLGLRPELGGRGAGGLTRALALVCVFALAVALAIGVRDGVSVP